MNEPSGQSWEQATFSDLLVRYTPAIRNYLARRTSSSMEAEDLTQEVLARVLKRAESGPIDNVEGYLFQAAANLLRESGRRDTLRNAAQIIEIQPELVEGEDVQTPERILMGRDAVRRIQAALNELPERTRTIFILSRFEDMKGTEIARRLGISASAVEKHMMRALAHLRRCAQ
ncbi:sigma-70 family RNA polymerase sigma factor [Asticcacaulis sp. BYS171W]|uniref:Sigma-70 family RNA polymerase sigma factor n=1 Tax=Asticcacaulis aquaticus TaxID=2984212 RepID=A0ABT5HW15_9CAUL|nr:sigma-70 family RNA polymerase sigma factor [Asticcacaulis aquaticus]MDC7684253.1 sigma-70 family RNA polymerase sigma factor [Asticcacaulis aquaticus]